MSKQKDSRTASSHHISVSHAVEVTLLSAFAAATKVDCGLLEECTGRGFFPLKLATAFEVLTFLSKTILAAQSAQRTYGVPASVLIAAALHTSSFDADGLVGRPEEQTKRAAFGRPKSATILGWFLETAARLAKGSKGRAGLSLLPGPDSAPDLAHLQLYINALCLAGVWDRMDAEDIYANIENLALDECDLAALFEPNEYARSEYSVFRTEKGGKKLRPFWTAFLLAANEESDVPGR